MTVDLNNLSAEELGLLFPIIMVDYNSDWPDIFLHERQKIIDMVGTVNISTIEHIGSTAVPGLCAKPTIDLLVVVNKDINTDFLKEKLNGINYEFIPKPENPPPHMMFAKGYSKSGITGQTYHIHIRYPGDWDEIVFRDYLKKNQDVAQEYAELKKKLSEEFRNNREKYTENKSIFIRQVIQKARVKIQL